MNKRAFLGLSFGTTIILLILLVFAVIISAIFFFPDALLPKIAEETKSFERFLPGKSEKEIPPGLDAPKETTEIFKSLYTAFENSKGKENCFVEYKSLDLGEYRIELEYIETEEGVSMFLRNPKDQIVDDYFVSGVQPCIALPSDNDKIAKESPLKRAEIRGNNELHYGGKEYDMFGNHPVLLASEGNDWACFFTDDTVIDPEDEKTYGTSGIWGWEGFESGDIKDIKKEKVYCKQEVS